MFFTLLQPLISVPVAPAEIMVHVTAGLMRTDVLVLSDILDKSVKVCLSDVQSHSLIVCNRIRIVTSVLYMNHCDFH